jgi:predicted secreted Zn-dependent protease
MSRSIICVLSALLIAMSALPAAAEAQMLCIERGKAVAALGQNYSEVQASTGLAGNGPVVEVFTSAKGSWTILMTYPSGLSCMLASGSNWENVARPVLSTDPG